MNLNSDIFISSILSFHLEKKKIIKIFSDNEINFEEFQKLKFIKILILNKTQERKKKLLHIDISRIFQKFHKISYRI